MDDTTALIVTASFAGIVVLAVLARRLLLRSNFPNLPGPPAGSLLTGNVHRMRSRHSIKYRKHVTDTHGPLFKLAGPYGAEWLYIYDPKALYSITIKDQDVWGKHGALLTMIMLGPGLLSTEHHQHRKQRKMLTPVFSAAYLRNITSVFYETTHKLRDDEAMQRLGEVKDVMSILLRANMTASEKDRLAEEELIAQVSTFILAGMDTTSNATSRVLHILASKTDAQTKLPDEILEAQAGTEVSYDTLMELPFLDAVCRETLRVYAPVTTISRYAVKDTVLGLSAPIRGTDGTLISEVPVPKGTAVLCDLGACNTNAALWGPDAREWKPELFQQERWLAPLPREVEEARVPGVYSNLMTVHGGGRSCIGFKYAQLELKVVLAVLLANFRFELSDKDIVWNSAGVMYPTVGPVSKKPEMPLKVSVFRERI
ncbi:cytochrome P450 [Epithele typhae]|uniref:cytochrome P450 n=1 Tax=Epithele typhae TaxID=378194 RepID=UPI002008B186|nr:cytochrome P450 [Epithele typhae]KAH9923760.1 cytochrome P450 [Epithele typhae]